VVSVAVVVVPVVVVPVVVVVVVPVVVVVHTVVSKWIPVESRLVGSIVRPVSSPVLGSSERILIAVAPNRLINRKSTP
jgi:hypothetical protein